MINSEPQFFSAADAHERLRVLYAERQAAVDFGMPNDRYWDQLHTEIQQTRAAYVGAAVTEIASLRGQISGRQQG